MTWSMRTSTAFATRLPRDGERSNVADRLSMRSKKLWS
jgi:hypothetical protein